MKKLIWAVTFICLGTALGFWLGRATPTEAASAEGKVFELRTYTTEDGKLEDLKARFRNHTTKIFERHGMTNIGYWIPADEPNSKNTLIYILAHKDRETAKKSWADFSSDPEWKKVKEASEANGKIVKGVTSVYMNAADFSKIK